MQVILYDCTDHLNPKWRGCTLRVIDDCGAIVLQGQVYGNSRRLGERIAAGFGVELKYVGPSPVRAAGDRVEVPPVLVAEAVVVHGPVQDVVAGVRNDGWLF